MEFSLFIQSFLAVFSKARSSFIIIVTRHMTLELERTHHLVMRVFQTILGIMEVNVYLAYQSATNIDVIHKDVIHVHSLRLSSVNFVINSKVAWSTG